MTLKSRFLGVLFDGFRQADGLFVVIWLEAGAANLPGRNQKRLFANPVVVHVTLACDGLAIEDKLSREHVRQLLCLAGPAQD
ncbi:hypothetical protein [Bradyrhizobium sp. CCBAU 11434]|uniref:hypothetical protein n=1 Tax=Bradyrhizobium sp. CCBAU 11434 TaxID=1630885 RepID=UPI002305DFDB|nr:hypothetical protein [Bradyrhizobium sp. CCBAU 11434]